MPTQVGKQRLKRIFVEGVEDSGEVALARVGQESNDSLALVLRAFRYLTGCIGGGTRRDADEKTLLTGKFATGADGVVVVNIKHLIDYRGIVGGGNEARADALYLVRTAGLTVQHG